MERVFETCIKTTPERLWQAIIERPDLPLHVRRAEFATAEILEAAPLRRLVQCMVVNWNEGVTWERRSRITWEIEPVGSSCRLRVTLHQLRDRPSEELCAGWPKILSAMKTLLETGRLPDTPTSLRISGPAKW